MDAKERKRLQRIQEAQIAARHPGDSKIRNYDWAKHAAKPQPKKPPWYLATFLLIPKRWRGAMIGLLLGSIFAIVLIVSLPAELDVLALLPLLICGVVGFVLGAVLQDDVKKW